MDKKEFEQYLKFKHPVLFELCIDISVDEGWQKVVKLLCENIQQHMDDHIVRVSVTQIKKKFGRLRVYYISDDPYVAGMIFMAQDIANNSCELCGADGNLVLVGKEIHTLCAEHALKYEEVKV